MEKIFLNTIHLEKDLESMEMRILESIWSLERSVLDEIESVRKLQNGFDSLKILLLEQKLGPGRFDKQ